MDFKPYLASGVAGYLSMHTFGHRGTMDSDEDNQRHRILELRVRF